jgi:hypothetical protein
MTKLTIEINDAVYRLAHVRAAKEGSTVSAKVREFLMQYAKVESASNNALPELPIFKGGSGLQQDIDPSSNKSMLQAANV